MTATADALRDLHTLHQRAKAVRDRLESGPKTLAVRQAALAVRQADLEKRARPSRTPSWGSARTSTPSRPRRPRSTTSR